MLQQHSPVTKAEIVGVIELFTDAVERILEEGGSLSTPLFNAQCSIAGKFTGAEDHFFKNRHEIKINLTPGSRIKVLPEKIKPQKTDSELPKPLIESFTDMVSGTVNSLVSPGGPAIIKGCRLNFDGEDPSQGIFFVAGNNSVFKVTSVPNNTFSQLVLMVPADLPNGNYSLQVKSKLKTQSTRIGELSKTLVVE
jgi:hypothetical protein